MSSPRGFLLSAAFAGMALFAACDSSTPTEADDDSGNPPIKSDGGSKRDSGAATPKKDASTNGTPDSATEEPEDAGGDADQPIVVGDGGPTLFEPTPGTPCTVLGEKFSRGCQNCGTQLAVCAAPAMTVTGYGACRDAEGECEPGSTIPAAACGACGTTTQLCNDQCVYVDQVCEGETGACVAGRTEQREAGCPTNTTKMYECTTECAWQAQVGATCTGVPAFPFKDIPATVGTTLTIPITAAEQGPTKGRRNAAENCAALSAQIVHGRFYELLNPTAKIAKLDVWARGTTNASLDLVLTSFDEPPFAAGDLIAACTAVNDVCGNSPYSATADVCLAGATAITVPANGRRWVYVGNYFSNSAAAAITLSVKTTSLQ